MKSETIIKWFPLGVSLDLVDGPLERVASSVTTELNRFIKPDRVKVEQQRLADLDALFSSVTVFTNSPTTFFVIPTKTRWTAMWNNSFLCDGYDSLCYCLTLNHGLSTMHWASSDVDGVFTAGSRFTFRKRTGEDLCERSVYCAREVKKWIFRQSGDPLPDEDLDWYSERPKRKRLDEARLMTLLAKLGATPWRDEFYDFRQPATRLTWITPPSTILTENYYYGRPFLVEIILSIASSPFTISL